MSTGRIVNTKRNIVFGLLQVCASYLAPFIIRTVLLYRFGVVYLGLNSLFSSILSILSLMEMGFGSAIVYSLYRPIAEGNQELVCAYLTYYRKIYRAIGFAVLIVGLALMPFLKSLMKDTTMPGNLNVYACYFLCNV